VRPATHSSGNLPNNSRETGSEWTVPPFCSRSAASFDRNSRIPRRGRRGRARENAMAGKACKSFVNSLYAPTTGITGKYAVTRRRAWPADIRAKPDAGSLRTTLHPAGVSP